MKIPGKEESKFNKEWHQANLMPKNATFAQRVNWHLEHLKNCSCRPIPEKLLGEMKQKGMSF
ncbi:hypothetical protein [Mucilaginibacter sp. NFX135]|uniref:hypothetical protein n=1 Tax=Mucilaginibacter sp. NFX135 TaxID=3402687 RepID=UPI003AFADAAA